MQNYISYLFLSIKNISIYNSLTKSKNKTCNSLKRREFQISEEKKKFICKKIVQFLKKERM